MFIVFTIILILYLLIVFRAAERSYTALQFALDSSIEQKKQIYESRLATKRHLLSEKAVLEEETLKIFTLYELTREVTKSISDEEALDIFRNKLKEHVEYTECEMYEPHAIEIKALRNDSAYYVFTLQSKNKLMGHLALKGIPEGQRENAAVLGHQFALALRRIKLYEEIERIAITDSLTGLFTRRYTFERFQEEIMRSKDKRMKLSVLMIDVDFFKKFNDNFGHLTGDRILREISGIIHQNIREIDIAGRFGGEEFFVILPDTNREGALYAAERIRKATEETTIKAYDASIKATVSVGIATFPEDGKSAEELVDKADWALYRSKKLGRNRVSSFGVYDK